MCNPRRVHVRVTSRLSEAWQVEIRETAEASDLVLGEARMTQPFGSALGRPARLAFERAVGADERWQWHDEAYRLDVDGGYALYHLPTGDLEIVAELAQVVRAQGEATLAESGVVEQTARAGANANYWDDGYGGVDFESAQQTAHAAAEAEAARQAAEGLDARLAEAEEAARRNLDARADEVRRRAEQVARQRLAADSERQRAELNRQAANQLEQVREQSMDAVHAVLAVAYRDAIIAYARQHGAENLQLREQGGIIDIQFEMEA